MATHSSILAWRIPWTEEPGGLQSMGLQRVRHHLVTKQRQQLNSEGCVACVSVSVCWWINGPGLQDLPQQVKAWPP